MGRTRRQSKVVPLLKFHKLKKPFALLADLEGVGWLKCDKDPRTH